ncbi:MAG: YdcF family protein, partial [Candidatus Omnitrophica bacterium]|nr:YdcF family protein [Candidatus Omnitrophota bacterium]
LRRLDHVLDLYRKEKVSYILCVGGARPRFKVFGSELMRQFLIDEGIPDGSVFSEKESFDSKTNWHMAYKVVKDHGWNKFIVVSSPFHLHRFRRIVRDDPRGYINVFFSPYSLKYAYPVMTYFDIWSQVHYEWMAHFSQLIPEKIYNKLIGQMRGQ